MAAMLNEKQLACVASIKAMIAEYSDPNMSVADSCIDKLVAADLAEEYKGPLDSIGCHPENRNKVGVEGVDVHDLVDKISKPGKGWSWSELRSPRAFEKAPGRKGEAQLAFNKKMVELAQGLLAPVSDHMRILSVTCSHTVSGVRCIKAGTKTTIKELANEDGRLDANKLFARCPSYREPVEKSIPFIVIDWRVEEAIPMLPNYLSEAGNGGHGMEQKQTQLQTLYQLHRMLVAEGGQVGSERLLEICNSIERNKPHLAGQCKSYADYVINFSGGDQPLFLDSLHNCSASLTFRREIPHQVLGAIGRSKLKSCVFYAVAAVQAMIASPANFSKDGVSTLLSSVDVNDMCDSKKRKQGPRRRTPT